MGAAQLGGGGWEVPTLLAGQEAMSWERCCLLLQMGRRTKRAEKASEGEPNELPDGATPVINSVQLLVQSCTGNYCKMDQSISNRKTALQKSKLLLPAVIHLPLKLVEVIMN